MVLTIDRTPAIAALLSLAVVLSGCQSTAMVADSDDPVPGETEEQPVAPDDPAPRETPEQADADAAVKAAEAAVEAAPARDVSDLVSRAGTAAGRAAVAAAAAGDLDLGGALRLEALLAEVRGELAAVLLALDDAAGDFADEDEALVGEVRSLVAEARTALDAAEAAVEADGNAEELMRFETFQTRAEGSLADIEAWIAGRTEGTVAAVGVARRAIEAQAARAEEAVAMSGAHDVVVGVAGVIERTAGGRGDGNNGWLHHGSDETSGSIAAAISRSYDGGDRVLLAVPYRGENGELEFYLGLASGRGAIHDDPPVYTDRHVDTAARDGATVRVSPVEGGLGTEWQGIEAAKSYGDAGTLSVSFFTDVAGSDAPGRPYAGVGGGFDRDLELHGIPGIPADYDGIFVLLLPPEGLPGSLDGVEGTFACAPAAFFFCGIVDDREEDFFPYGYDPIVFTPDGGGEAEELTSATSAPVAASNWLAFGHWLYTRKDPANSGAFDFGVFASGGDPYPGNDLAGLTGSASYSGKAAGMYTQPSESGTDIGTFSANVELTADFGDAAATGTISGRVFDFALENGGTPALTELRLGTAVWHDPEGTTNIFPGIGDSAVVAGGWIEGDGTGSGAGDDGWQGGWGGKLYGTGAGLPTSVAGTFGAANAAGDGEYAGAFGAYRQSQ